MQLAYHETTITEVAVVPSAPRRHSIRVLAAVFLSALTGAGFLYKGLWMDIHHAYLANADGDENAFEWLFAAAVNNLKGFNNPFHTYLENAPAGVNLMANATMLGLAIPLAGWTTAFGPEATYALLLTMGLALTTVAWFWLFSRWLVNCVGAAAIAAFFCGFAPPMISHGNAHPNFVFAPLLPLIVDRVLRLCVGSRERRNGLILGILIAYQIYLGEELLFLCFLGMALFLGVYALMNPAAAIRGVRPLLKGLSVATAVTLLLTAYALHWQFSGPGSYGQIINYVPPNQAHNFTMFPTMSLGSHDGLAKSLAGSTEQNAFFGWPLLLLIGVMSVALWGHLVVRAALALTVVAALFSMGPSITVPGTQATIPGPWRALSNLPLLDSIVVSRLSMICIPGIAIVLAVTVEQLWASRERYPRLLGLGAVVAALAPIIPTPYPVVNRPEIPSFISSGDWKSVVRPGHTLLVAPLPSAFHHEPLHWATKADLGFALPGGYFRGPDASGRYGLYGAVPRPTGELFDAAARTGIPIPIDSVEQEAAQADFKYWQADALIIDPAASTEALRQTIEQLVGKPTEVIDGVLVWRLTSWRPTPGMPAGLPDSNAGMRTRP